MVTPSSLWICDTRSKIVSATVGAKPIDGSSSINNRGALARPRPIATICCSPPDSVPASCIARSARIGNSVWMRSKVWCHASRPAFGYAPISRFSRTVRVLNTCRPSGTWAIPRCARCAGARAKRFSPMKVICPAAAGTIPEIVLNSVDLPAPFGPTIVTNWPSCTASETSVSARRPPYETDRLVTSSMLSGRPFLAEVGLDHTSILHHLSWRAARQDTTVIQHDKAIRDPHHRVHRVLDDHDRHALAPKALQHVQHVVALVAAQARQSLVQQHQPWRSRQRSGQFHQPKLLVGQLPGG